MDEFDINDHVCDIPDELQSTVPESHGDSACDRPSLTNFGECNDQVKSEQVVKGNAVKTAQLLTAPKRASEGLHSPIKRARLSCKTPWSSETAVSNSDPELPLDSDAFRIINKQTKTSLTAAYGKKENGTPAIMWRNEKFPNHLWYFVEQ